MNNYKIFIFLIIQALVSIFVIVYFDGTGDSGDSIMHYLFAKYAFQHPELFFDHWAKPVYVLLASPLAQFGIVGIKIFNAIVSLLTIFVTIKTIQRLNINNETIGAILLFCSPLFFILTFSGLTEPLFALILISGVYLILSNRLIASAILISFLPFVRSEGLIFLGIFGLYFILQRNWKLLPLLMVGHIAYSIAGFPIHKDLFWIFNKIPYVSLQSTYGDGRILHFVEQLFYVVGVPVYILFWIGVFASIKKLIKRELSIDFLVLIFLGFFTFLLAHTLFWYFGVFNSMGLKRVLVGVAPLSAIISLVGFNFLSDLLKQKKMLQLMLQSIIVGYVILFLFTHNPAAIDWKSDMSLSADQKLANQVGVFMADCDTKNHRFFYVHPYLSEALQIDHFNMQKRLGLTKDVMEQIKTGDFLIWENWLSVVECGITKEYLDGQQELIQLYHISSTDEGGREVQFSVYQRQ